MRIIKEGMTRDLDRERRFTCRCAAVIGVSENEIKESATHDQRNGSYYTVTCPCCKEKSYVDITKFRQLQFVTVREGADP